LRYFVEGAQGFLREGLDRPTEIADATGEYRTESDSVGAFVDEWCMRGERLQESGGDLHRAYVEYCRKNGGDDKLASNTFAERLKRRGFRKGAGRKRRSWQGIQLTDQARQAIQTTGQRRDY
jgi:putative DNA primase/helicase